MTDLVQMSYPMVQTGEGLPDVCARHGEPCVRRTSPALLRPMPWWLLLLAIGSGLLIIVMIVWRLMNPRLKSAGWPVCSRCVAEHRSGHLVAAGVLLGSVALTGFGLYTANGTLFLKIVCVALLVVGLVLTKRAQWTRYLQIRVDKTSVIVRKPHPAFEAAVGAGELVVRAAHERLSVTTLR